MSQYLKLQLSHTALAIYNEFKGQLIPAIFSLLGANNIKTIFTYAVYRVLLT